MNIVPYSGGNAPARTGGASQQLVVKVKPVKAPDSAGYWQSASAKADEYADGAYSPGDLVDFFV